MKLILTLLLLDFAILTIGAIAIKTIVLIPVGLIAVFAGCVMTVDTIKNYKEI